MKTLMRFPVEYQAYDGSWQRLFYVDHIDLDGAARFAVQRIREIAAATVIPSAPILRVRGIMADKLLLASCAA